MARRRRLNEAFTRLPGEIESVCGVNQSLMSYESRIHKHLVLWIKPRGNLIETLQIHDERGPCATSDIKGRLLVCFCFPSCCDLSTGGTHTVKHVLYLVPSQTLLLTVIDPGECKYLSGGKSTAFNCRKWRRRVGLLTLTSSWAAIFNHLPRSKDSVLTWRREIHEIYYYVTVTVTQLAHIALDATCNI